ncbi:MAG: response regulator [Betaproteobacteria bacterium]|nr:response regulator [Betaproteobacteria bacterium]
MIDDSPTILTAMKRFLESAHCVFIGALDARMGMEFALTQKPDIIFLDIVMPGINGFAALRALRKNSRTRETPIIMMSGNEQAKAQFFGAHIGADDFMKKPFSRFEVFARIARLLDDDRIPRRSSGSSTSTQDARTAEVSSTEEAVSQQTVQPQSEIETLLAPPSRLVSRRTTRIIDVPAIPSSDLVVLTSDQVVEQTPVVVDVFPQPVEPQPDIHAAHVAEKEPAVPLQAQPEPSLEPAHPVSAQVVHITQPPAQETPHLSVSTELLSRIARLAQLAQSDPEALKALVVLSAQLAAQYAAAASSQEAVTQARAAAT